MAFIPVVSVSRSQQVRLGHGPGHSVVPEIPLGDLPNNPQNGALNVLFYANLNDGWTRKDYQHHAAIGALDSVGSLSLGLNTSSQPNSDLFVGAAPTYGISSSAITATAFTLNGRTFGGSLDVPASSTTVTPNAASTNRTDALCVDNTGRVFIVQGIVASAAVAELDTLTIGAGTPTSGSLTLSFVYQGETYTTSALVPATTNSQVAAAVKAAATLPNTVTGGGMATVGTAGGGAITVTGTAGAYALSSLKVASNTLSPAVTATFVQTTAGSPGPQAPVVGGVSQTLCTFTVAAGASVPSSVSSNVAPTS